MQPAPLSLYRALLRAARLMPTSNRRQYIKKRARAEFESSRGETDPARIRFLMDFGMVSLDNIHAQAAHLNANVTVVRDGAYSPLFAPAKR